MSVTWTGRPPPPPPALSPGDWLRVVRRGAPAVLILALGLMLLLALRLPERLIWGVARPVTPWITQGVCILTLRFFGIARTVEGEAMRDGGAFVANHASWLDIFALNASKRLYFVAKSEVRGWAGIGWLARATGTVFIRRDRADARGQAQLLETRLKAGHRLLFFPEGTSTDGCRVLPFRTTLFQPFFADGLAAHLKVQPVSIVYRAPDSAPAEFYGWWGDTSFGASLLAILATPRQGAVHVVYHAPLRVADFENRKALARAAERSVRAGFERISGGAS